MITPLTLLTPRQAEILAEYEMEQRKLKRNLDEILKDVKHPDYPFNRNLEK